MRHGFFSSQRKGAVQPHALQGYAGGSMIKKEDFYYNSRDRLNRIHACRWLPEGSPCAVLQIVHGMAEYIDRYDGFARYMAEKGFLVTGEDHLGHGKTAREKGDYGYFCEQDPATVAVRDVHRLKKITQEAYPGIPYYILGHSMGSFITRNYLCRYGSGIDGALILGTGMQPKALLAVSKVLARVQELFFGSRHPSRFLNFAAFAGYNRRISKHRTEMDWLSADEKVVDAYRKDPMCGFTFTVNGFQTLFELIWRLHKKSNLRNLPKDLPVFVASGTDDPVGGYGKGVQAAVRSMKAAGMRRITVKMYDKGRHELLNETGREQVWKDIYQWLSRMAAEK